MKNILIAAVSIFLSAGSVLAQSVTEKAGVNSALGISPSTPDFVKEAAIGDMFEIQSSTLAKLKSDAATKAFAEKMITDHSKTTDEIKKLSKTPVPTQMDSSHQAMLDNLTKLNDRDFTRNYHDDQVTAHKQAVSLYERYAKGGDDAGLKAFAQKTLPTLQEHLKMAQDLDK